MHLSPSRLERLALPAILVLAALLRFQSLPQRGFLYWDEGKFALEGIRLLAVLRHLGHEHAPLAGKAIGTAKPTHALLIALTYALVGIHAYAPLLMNATASLLQVVVLYLLARRLFGIPIALTAALFLAVSEYDVIYARSALSESDANLFFLLAVFIWSLSWNFDTRPARLLAHPLRARLLAGLLLGLGLTTNYRLLPYLAVLLVLDAVLLWRRGGWLNWPSALGWLSLAVVPLLWEGAGLLAATHGLTLFRSEITYRPQNYLGEMLYQIHGGKQSVFRFDPGSYLAWYIVRQGWPAFLLLLAGLALALWQRTLRWLLPASLVLIPYAGYVFAPFIVPRNLDTTLPFDALLAAAALAAGISLVSARPLRPLLLLVVALALALVGSALSWRLGAERSGFALAAHYLDAHTRDGGAVISNEVMIFYLRDGITACDALPLQHSLRALAADRQHGYAFAVVDVYNTHVKRYLLHSGARIARFLASGTTGLGENPIASENGSPPGGHLDQHVDIYRLSKLRLPTTGDRHVPACALNHLA